MGEAQGAAVGGLHASHRALTLSVQRYVNEYVQWYGRGRVEPASLGPAVPPGKTDGDVLAEESRFVWREEDMQELTAEKRFAIKYYRKLFKEYCLVDLAQHKTGQIGMRWRTEAEVREGKGQFVCARLRCRARKGLCSWELNFRYEEKGESRLALVKVRLCAKCSDKLNYANPHARAGCAGDDPLLP